MKMAFIILENLDSSKTVRRELLKSRFHGRAAVKKTY